MWVCQKVLAFYNNAHFGINQKTPTKITFFGPKMNYPAAELQGIKMNFYFINPGAEDRGILLIKFNIYAHQSP